MHADEASYHEPGGRFTWLLVALLVCFVTGPLLLDVVIGPFAQGVVHTLIILAAIYATSRNRRLLLVSFSMVVLTLLAEIGRTAADLQGFTGAPRLTLAVAEHVLLVGFFGLIISYCMVVIMRSETITAETIRGGVCVYLLLAVLFSGFFSLTELLDPGAFDVPAEFGGSAAMTWTPPPGAVATAQHASVRGEVSMYLSFTTLTTLGFGDITPRSTTARMLTSFEALLGQLFLTVLVARLVGMHIAGHGRARKTG